MQKCANKKPHAKVDAEKINNYKASYIAKTNPVIGIIQLLNDVVNTMKMKRRLN